MERVEIYGWTMQAGGGWRAVAIAVRSHHPERQRRLMYTGKTAEEAVQALARLTAILSTTCRRRGKRVVLRLLKEPPREWLKAGQAAIACDDDSCDATSS